MEIIDRKDPVVVISHMNPDGDAIGSSLALALFLRNQDVPVSVILPNEVPDFLKWLPGFELVSVYSLQREVCKELGIVEGKDFVEKIIDGENMKPGKIILEGQEVNIVEKQEADFPVKSAFL